MQLFQIYIYLHLIFYPRSTPKYPQGYEYPHLRTTDLEGQSELCIVWTEENRGGNKTSPDYLQSVYSSTVYSSFVCKLSVHNSAVVALPILCRACCHGDATPRLFGPINISVPSVHYSQFTSPRGMSTRAVVTETATSRSLAHLSGLLNGQFTPKTPAPRPR